MAKKGSTKSKRRNRTVRWERLDNTAHLFPIIANDEMSNVYRISVTLKEKIQPKKLQMALDRVLPNFPGFNLRLRKGFFWYYFEENGKPAPDVKEEDTYPCQFIVQNQNRSYMFRVTYYQCRINMEVFHVLTDGMGTINFLKELTYEYLRICHPDQFKTEKAFLIKGDKLPKNHLGVIHGYMKLDQLKATCRKYDVSINEYLVAVFAYSTYREYNLGGKAIRIAVPVNLRPYFESVTTKNFFVMVSAEFKPEETHGVYTFVEVVEAIKNSLRNQVTKEHLENLFSYNVSNQMNFVARAIPLPLKNIGIKTVYTSAALANTTTVTNIGNIKVAPEYEPYIENFGAILAMSKGQNLKGTVCSYGDVLTFTFSSALEETHVQRRFFRTLVQDGVDVEIESNGVYYESM